ncbi:peptidylprolyl isomerase [Actomonas aquatica]|uniref:peptidylprolyl isomerase n=1 Tax=Actomonas aquatica TaxID=2866162 RepID=A0ABZ1C5X8_9BACT|nr:peptidylprolyl isomerase [Opitutus sp. WL0086]WRQ87004.1 peptidylprolyl isomerase [Opitutus sp. WL0086]
MKRPEFRFALLSAALALATGLTAQDRPLPTGAVPVVSSAIPDQSGQVGGATVSVDLREHLDLNTERTGFVRFDTTFGKLDVELLPDHAPLNAANFLTYVRAGHYDGTIIHRTAFFDAQDNLPEIVQGGGYTPENPPQYKTPNDPVVLEYSHPNERGTLAAARTQVADSATSQWYFNTSDNTTGLGQTDGQGGYSVFGKTVGSGMAVVDTMGLVNTFAYNTILTDLPLRFFSGGPLTEQNFVNIFSVYEVPLYPAAAGDEAVLNFSATSSDESVVMVTVDGSNLILTPVSAGNATITVAAETISEDRVEDSFVFASTGLGIAQQPQSQDVSAGASATFTVDAPAANGTNTYQWYVFRSGMAEPAVIAGATGASYTVNNVQAANMGAYFVRVTNGGDTVQSDAALLTLTGGTSRLSNLSTRGRIPAGGSLTPGFVLTGDGNKPLVVRAVGPTLIDFGLTAGLLDPTMDIIPQGLSESVVSNDNWGDAANAATLVTTSNQLGAFPLTAASLDAALLTDVALPNSNNNRGYTVRIQSTDAAASGIALAEVYDPEALGAATRLVNVSALGYSGTGDDALVPGFVIEGSGAKTMLIRVVGPSLEQFNVGGRMADPRLTIVPLQQSFAVAANDNWGGTDALKTAFGTTGAFSFSGDASLDAAVLVRLPPGGYTVVVAGAAGGTGQVLVEAYDVQ